MFVGKDYAHGLHAPYWWIKCAVGVHNDDHLLARAYHKLLGLGDRRTSPRCCSSPASCSTR